MTRRVPPKVHAILSTNSASFVAELRESRVWIRFIIRAELWPAKKMEGLEDESTQLCNIIGKSIVTAKENAAKNK